MPYYLDAFTFCNYPNAKRKMNKKKNLPEKPIYELKNL